MKKLLSFLLAALLTASVCITSVSAVSVDDFSDMPNDWSTAALTAAVNNGLLTGSDGLILPKDNLTRAQMAAIIVRAFNASTEASLDGFTDVPADKWYYTYMSRAVAMGVFNGDGSGLLTPDANITREQVFAVLARAFKLEDGDPSILNKFADAANVSSWAVGYAAALVGNGYVNGSDGYLNPKANITRAEFAQIMYNMVSMYVDESTRLVGTLNGNIIVRASDVRVDSGTVITGTLILCEGVRNVSYASDCFVTNKIDNRSDEDKATDMDEGEKYRKKAEEQTITPGTGFWIVDGPTTPTDPKEEKPEDITDNTDDDGWTKIYRP